MVSYVITGANRGIGLGFVKILSSDPKNEVFALTRNKDNSKELSEIQSSLKNVHMIQADITDVHSLREAAKIVDQVTGGTLDVLVNNAAHLGQDSADYTLEMYNGQEDFLDEDFTKFFRVNVLGVIKTTNIFLPLLRKASQTTVAKVITISSAAGDMEFIIKTRSQGWPPYAVSKAACNMAMAKYAARFKDDNFLFVSLSPGLVNTISDQPEEAQEAVYGKIIRQFKEAYPDWDGVPMTPEESVTAMLNTVSKLSTKDSGKFLTHHGDSETWL